MHPPAVVGFVGFVVGFVGLVVGFVAVVVIKVVEVVVVLPTPPFIHSHSEQYWVSISAPQQSPPSYSHCTLFVASSQNPSPINSGSSQAV